MVTPSGKWVVRSGGVLTNLESSSLDNSDLIVYTISDSSGETAEAVTRAALAQFAEGKIQLYRLPSVCHAAEFTTIMEMVAKNRGIIAYTLVRDDLIAALRETAANFNVTAIDILGPLIDKIAQITGNKPLSQAGRLHLLDESYFKRMAAIDFAIRFDDGKSPSQLKDADVVLIGVSRTSKTPNCMYLAQHWGLKAANIPLVPNISPPPELFTLASSHIVGLTINPKMLAEIRTTRAAALRLPLDNGYTDPWIVQDEIEQANKIFKRLDCRSIDVTNKAIEETSSEIYLYLRNQ